MRDSTVQTALFTDFYELTMAQGYWKKNMARKSVFEMFFRKHPFQGGFSVFAGLGPLLEKLAAFSFSADDIAYLRSLSFFEDGFLDYLARFRFSGAVHAMEEGTVVFPQEPLVRITGDLIECQLVEGLVLNTINFQSLIATKTARVYLASQGGLIMEFGLRRAQGVDGALSATRASIIGGAAGTSNVLGGKEFGVKVMGTMAHSWVMAFGSEEEAFAAYAEIYPQHPVFLIDTFDTLNAGLPNAIKVGKEIVRRGGNFGVRLDSGDLYYLTSEVRKALDKEGLHKATIAVSNDLDEDVIEALMQQGAPINSWGVGTRMVTGGSDAAFTGVYKLAAFETPAGQMIPAIKVSDNPEKTTNPAVKQVLRLWDNEGAVCDVLVIDGIDGIDGDEEIREGETYTFWHPSADYRHFRTAIVKKPEPLLTLKMENGKMVVGEKPLAAIQKHTLASLAEFDDTYKRNLNPHIYKVSVTENLRDLKLRLIKGYLGERGGSGPEAPC
ncbi:MAG: nicotinate phosphoribosyltransferase [Spirochaetaceae bacterium]|nr:nicotinate phosphoribosyltransferase [Spirochaetaceae bacterium]